MNRTLARFSLALTLAVLVAGGGHAQQKEDSHLLKGSFTTHTGTEAFRNDNLGRPYITEKAGSWANWNYVATTGSLQLVVQYPVASRYVELDFGTLAPGAAYPTGTVSCTLVGKGTPASVAVPAFLQGGFPYILNPTQSFRITTGKEYTWKKTGTVNGQDVYDWAVGAATFDLWNMPDGTRYIQAWVTFTTGELQAINATAYLAFDSQTGVNPIGQVPSLLQVTRSGDKWTLTPMPAVNDIDPDRLSVASLTLQLTPMGTRKGYHSCPLGAYVMPFVLELWK